MRTICENGDTSAWLPYQYFRLLQRCEDIAEIGCGAKKTINIDHAQPYFYRDYCSNKTLYGRQHFEFFRVWLNGPYSLRVNAGSQPVNYFLSKVVSSECDNLSVMLCDTLTGIDTIQLAYLTQGRYVLQITSQDTITQQVELACACPKPNSPSGTLFANGSAYLKWLGGSINTKNWEIEIVPVGSDFSGTPNYYGAPNPYIATGLDPSVSYKFRVRSNCGAGITGIWSAESPIYLITDCASIPDLNCGQTTILNFPGGSGLFDYKPCGAATTGKEFFFRINAEFTGLYRLVVLEASGNTPKVSFGVLDDCGNPNGMVSCVGRGAVGTYWLGYMRAGKSYIVVADDETHNKLTYKIHIACWPPNNDGPAVFFFPLLPVPDVYIINVGDTCELFTNRLATPDPQAPDLSKPPSNWKDGLEHDVWFEFVAPPGGTVQINVKSDPDDPMDPQVALLQLGADSVKLIYKILATAEDNTGPQPQDASLVYTGLTPGERYHIVVDGANNSVGRFCLQILDEPENLADHNSCQTYQASAATFGGSGTWRNLYAGSGQHVTGLLLGAVKSKNNLGLITISSETLPESPVLPNGQKFLPRYFNIETQYQPQQPATLRLFFNADDLAVFNSTAPTDSINAFQLGLSHYDGAFEDCSPVNNVITGGFIPVLPADAVQVGKNGKFYLEANVNRFSEFSGAIPVTVKSSAIPTGSIAVRTFPNPVEHTLFVQFRSDQRASFQLKLVNLLGATVLEQTIEARSAENEITVPVANLSPGIYQLFLQNEGVPVGQAKVVKF